MEILFATFTMLQFQKFQDEANLAKKTRTHQVMIWNNKLYLRWLNIDRDREVVCNIYYVIMSLIL